jgi:hypothetical protein
MNQDALSAYSLVFDAVYTPRTTKLLREAAEVGAAVVSGMEMFIRQAYGQFELFTGQPGELHLFISVFTGSPSEMKRGKAELVILFTQTKIHSSFVYAISKILCQGVALSESSKTLPPHFCMPIFATLETEP